MDVAARPDSGGQVSCQFEESTTCGWALQIGYKHMALFDEVCIMISAAYLMCPS